MKKKLLSMGLLAGLAASAMANQVVLKNVSADHHQPMVVNYQVAQQNPGEPVVLSPIQTAQLNDNVSIPVELGTYQYAGIVVTAVNGHEIPAKYHQFLNPENCSLATDQTHLQGELDIAYVIFADRHGQISCAAQGGARN